ncbi:MAG: nucleotidyltransferase family protein [Firmicutes bacterium]|nr:nucleotidyltransferase family protein [Bacillota bacterium]
MEKYFIKGVISLVKSAFTGEKAELPDDFDFARAYALAKSHRVIPLLYYGIVNSGIKLEAELNNKYFAATCQSIAVGEKQKFELSNLSMEFEKNGIDFMPLKGSVIRSLYPKQEMRSMGDADILIRAEQYDKIVPMLKNNGFTFVKESSNELCWEKLPFYIELHRYLVSPSHKDYFKVFGNGWQLAKPSEGFKHRFEMSDEDFFVFLFAHFTKHYRSSGIGIKHMTDIWVYLKAKPELDIKYIERELDKLKMLTFYKNVLRTVNAWFENAEFDDITYLITVKIFSSGAFGTRESYAKSNALKDLKNGEAKNIRSKKIFNAVFLPYKNMCILFPFLKKAPVLLPFMWIYRGVYTVFCKNGALTSHYNEIKGLSPEQLSEYQKELNSVGLDYHFEE